MPRFYYLMAGLALLSVGARAQAPVTNLQVSNITATSATITFDGGKPFVPYGCSTRISYRYVNPVEPSVIRLYAMPLQLTGLQPGRTVEVRITNTRPNPTSGGSSCLSGPAATITFTTLAALAATPAAGAGQLTLAPNPARDQATLTLAAALPQPTPVLLLDALGRPVRQQVLPARATTAVLDVAGLPAGLYLLRCGAVARRLRVE